MGTIGCGQKTITTQRNRMLVNCSILVYITKLKFNLGHLDKSDNPGIEMDNR